VPSPAADWQRKVDAVDALFSADDSALPWRSQAGLGNGMLGGVISGSLLNMAGVFSGSVRASVPTALLSARLGSATAADPLTPRGALLDLREAIYSRRYSGRLPPPNGSCADHGVYGVEQRFYAHRAVPSLVVMEVDVTVPCGCQWGRNLTLVVSHDRPDTGGLGKQLPTVKFTNTSETLVKGASVSIGTTVHPEGGALPGKAAVLEVVTVATRVPAGIEVPSAQRCGNFSHRFLHVVRSSLNGTVDVLSAARVDYAKAMAARRYTVTTAAPRAPDGLRRAHVAAWAVLWRSGLEVGGRREAAVAANASLYAVLSSLRADWPYGCSPTGLYSTGWAGLAFWDCACMEQPWTLTSFSCGPVHFIV
jgi:hypothetical protein